MQHIAYTLKYNTAYTSSYNTVVLYSRDRYEIIGLLKLSHSIKQPCSSVCLKIDKELVEYEQASGNAVIFS